jgi:hypothetical protein
MGSGGGDFLGIYLPTYLPGKAMYVDVVWWKMTWACRAALRCPARITFQTLVIKR